MHKKRRTFTLLYITSHRYGIQKNRVKDNRKIFEITAFYLHFEFSRSGFPCWKFKGAGISKIFLYPIFIHILVCLHFADLDFQSLLLFQSSSSMESENNCVYHQLFKVFYPWPLWITLLLYACLNIILVVSATYK